MATPTKKPAAPKGPLNPLSAFEHDREIGQARFSPCGKYVFIAGTDALVHRWTLDGNKKAQLKGHDGWVEGLVFHPDKKRMFTSDSWGRVCAWNYADEAPTPIWTKPDLHKGWTKALAISPDGSLLATCGADKMVRLWSTQDGAPKGELAGHESCVFSVQFHPDGKSLVSGDLRGIVKQWDLATSKSVREFDAHLLFLRADEINEVGGVRLLSFDPTGQTLCAGGAQPITSGFVTAKPSVILFDWATGKQKQLLQLGDAAPDDGFAYDVLHHPRGFLAIVCGGAPGRGALWCWKPGDKSPFYINKELPHCRSISLIAGVGAAGAAAAAPAKAPKDKDDLALEGDAPAAKAGTAAGNNDRFAIAQVGRGGGNGRQLDAKGEYLGNTGTVRIYESTVELPKA